MADQTQVVVVGAGPTGLMLACELRLAGLGVVLLDRATGRSGESRAGGLHARTMEVLDQRGILEEFLKIGREVPAGHFSGLWLDLKQLDTPYPFVLGILQARVEALLEQRAVELGVPVTGASEVIGVEQDAGSVTVRVRDAPPIVADYVVGCDGGRSAVRRLAGIGFTGTDATMTSYLGDVELADPPAGPIFQQRTAAGNFTVLQLEPGWHRVMTSEFDRVEDRDAPIDFATLRDTFTRIAGTDHGMHSPRWVSRFGDATRQAERYRAGRVLLAGDAAHIHYPAGGQGLNTGVQDAVNLGWKLAMVLRGHTDDALLDTYETERHPVAARVLHNTRAQTALARVDPHTTALRDIVQSMLAAPEANAYLAGMLTGLDIRYGEVGTRAPATVFHLLHEGRPVLTGPLEVLAAGRSRADRLDLALSPHPMLVRPDGYLAWHGGDGLEDALSRWFGAPSYTQRRAAASSAG